MISALFMLVALTIVTNHFNSKIQFSKLFDWIQACQISLTLAIFAHWIPQFSPMADEGTERLVICGAILLSVVSFKSWRLGIPRAGVTFFGVTLFNLIVIPLLLFLPTFQSITIIPK
jgi:hypothetical protein